VTREAGSTAAPHEDELADGEELAEGAAPPLPRRIPGQARKFWPGRPAGATQPEPRPEVTARLGPGRLITGKPTPADLGIDLATLEWESSGDGEGRIEVAFPVGPRSGETAWSRGEWVLMRMTGDPTSRVLVFDRNEWECFLDGARNGEFDDAV
jgi:hypothetical protein